MKKFISKTSIFIVVTLILMTFSTVLISASSTQSIKLSSTKFTIAISETKNLTLKNTNGKVTWSSKDKLIATVDTNGKVIGKDIGETIIIAKVGDDEYYCEVTVKEYRIYAKSSTMQINEIQTLALRGKTSGKTITWLSSDKSIATVSDKGVVTALKKGEVKIRATIDGIRYSKTLIIENAKQVENKTSETVTSTLGTRQNPYPANNNKAIELQKYSSENVKKINLTVKDVITGKEANEIINSENMFNKKPTSNQEWRIYTFQLKYILGDEEDILEASDVIFDRYMFNQQGQSIIIHDTATLGDKYGAYNIYDVKLYPGGSGQVVYAILTDKTEGVPLIQVNYNSGKNSNWVSCEIKTTSNSLNSSLNTSTTSKDSIENKKQVENKTSETVTSTLGTRQNPYTSDNNKIIEFQKYNSNNIKQVKLTIKDVFTGTEANNIINSENIYNNKPSSNQEWRIYIFELKYITGDEDDILKASDIIFENNMFNQQGQSMIIHDTATLGDKYSAYNIYDVKLYPGGSSQVVYAILTDKTEGVPLIQVKYNGGKNSNWVSCEIKTTSNFLNSSSNTSTTFKDSISSKYPFVPDFENYKDVILAKIEETKNGYIFYYEPFFEPELISQYSDLLRNNNFEYIGNFKVSGKNVANYKKDNISVSIGTTDDYFMIMITKDLI